MTREEQITEQAYKISKRVLSSSTVGLMVKLAKWADANPDPEREAAIQKLVEALEFYASAWGEHQGSPISAVNKFTQNKLNGTRQAAIEALDAWNKLKE
jgi:hypothetical protein